MPEKLVTISTLARLLKTTNHTIRYYEDEGLFKPAEIAPNGYRKYGMSQAYQLSFILFLRQLDFSVASIKQILQTNPSVTDLLLAKKIAIQTERHRLEQLEKILDDQLNIHQSSASPTLKVATPIYLQSVKRLPIDYDFGITEIMDGNWNPDFILRKLYYVITPDYYDICLVSTKPTSQKIAPGEYQLTPIKASSAESFDQQLAPYLKNQKRIIALEDRRGFLTANSNLVVHLLIQKT